MNTALVVSNQDLPEPTQRCYRLAGLHPGPEFGIGPIAAALDVTPPQAGQLVGALVRAGLLTEVGESGRYRTHDLVELYTKGTMVEDPQLGEGLRRIVEWYTAGVRAADRLVVPYRRRPEDCYRYLTADAVVLGDRNHALAWMEAERVNLVAAVRAAAAPWPELAWQITDAMSGLFLYRQHDPDRLAVARIGLEVAERLGHAQYQARSLRRLGWVHLSMDELPQAKKLFQRALPICEQRRDSYEIATTAHALGTVAFAQHHHRSATHHLHRALRVFERLGEPQGMGLVLITLGQMRSRAGELVQALEYLARASTMLDGLGDRDPYNAARARLELGIALLHGGRLGRAGTELAKALAAMTQLGALQGRAHALRGLGDVALARGMADEARGRLNAALAVYDQMGEPATAAIRRLLATLPDPPERPGS